MIQKIFVYGSLIIFAGTICLVAYWMVWPYDPLTVVQPLPVATKVVKPGERLSLEFDFCNRVAVPVTSRVSFYRKGVTSDHLVDTLEATTTRTVISKIQCQKIVNERYVIPSDYIPGEYWLRIVADYQVNPIRSIREEIYSEHFEVIK